MPKFRGLLILAGILFLQACGGGGSGGEGDNGGGGDTTPPAVGDTTPPAVSTTVPANSATGVAPAAAITASLNEAVDAVTISAATFTVNGVTGTVTYDAASHTATFMPAAPLAFGTTYTATMTTQVKDLAGNAMAANHVWTFTTRAAPAWGTASQIGAGTNSPQIAIDPNGNALAVWHQFDGTSYNIYANRYAAGTGWGTADLIETGDGDAFLPQIAFDTNGNAIAAWQQSDGIGYNIHANRYTAGAGWGAASLIETNDTGSAYSPQLAIDPNGNAIAVWSQHDGTRYNVWANRYDAVVAGWGTANLIGTATADVRLPRIATDRSGNAIAVWVQDDGTGHNVWANRYDAAVAGWGTASLIQTATGYANSPQIAIDPKGNAIAVWVQSDDNSSNIYANRYTAVSGWGTASLIETTTGNAYSPQVAIDPKGNAIAVWSQYNGTGSNIYANRYTAVAGWGTTSLIQTTTGNAYSPQVAIDPKGYAIAVWVQGDGIYDSIYGNRYTAGAGWGTASLIETGDGDASAPRIAIDPNGNAIAVWQQHDGTRYGAWVNRFE